MTVWTTHTHYNREDPWVKGWLKQLNSGQSGLGSPEKNQEDGCQRNAEISYANQIFCNSLYAGDRRGGGGLCSPGVLSMVDDGTISNTAEPLKRSRRGRAGDAFGTNLEEHSAALKVWPHLEWELETFLSSWLYFIRPEARLLPLNEALKKWSTGTSLVVQLLRLCAPSTGGPGSIPGQGTRSYMPQWWLKIPSTTTEDPGQWSSW